MDRFKVVFSGQVLDGFEADQVKSAFGQLFSVQDRLLARSFDGRPVDVTVNIDREKADRLAETLQRLGMRVSVEPDQSLMDMRCPKCDFIQARAEECSSCGVIIKRYLSAVARDARDQASGAGSKLAGPSSLTSAVLLMPLASLTLVDLVWLI